MSTPTVSGAAVNPSAAATSPQPDLVRGAQLQLLFLKYDAWVHRRVETVRFTEDGLVRRFVSVDFAVSPRWKHVHPSRDTDEARDVVGKGDGSILVPLALLRKEPLALLDVVDEAGASLSVLGTLENGFLAYSTLCSRAVQVLKVHDESSLDRELVETLYAIAVDPPGSARKKFDALENSGIPEAHKVAQDPIFQKLASDFASNFILLVEVFLGEDGWPSRRIVKFSYTIDAGATTRRNFAEGWGRPNERTFRFKLPSIGHSQSHHFQLSPPHGVVVSSCKALTESQQDEPGTVVGGTAHLHVGRAGLGTKAKAEVRLSPQNYGPILSSMVSTGIIAAVMTVLLVWTYGAVGTPADASDEGWLAVLVAVPGVAASYLANQGELGVLSRLLAGARGMLLVGALVSFGVAVALILGIDGHAWVWTLRAAVIVSAGCFARLVQWSVRCHRATSKATGLA